VPSLTASTDDDTPVGAAAAPTEAELRPTFEQIYDQRFHDVLRWVRALGGIDADLEDVTQEVFVIVQRKLDDFDGQNLNAWLYRIAKNQVRDHRRRAWLRRFLSGTGHDTDPSSTPLHGQPAATPQEELERRESLKFISQTLAKMTVAQRSAFVLFEIEGYSGEEIAELEGIPANTVWTRLHAARKTFFSLVDRARAERRLP
jgi:RNA polymerase sigma-70 factor (ECF subfamily)